jgi:cell division protease FtsH
MRFGSCFALLAGAIVLALPADALVIAQQTSEPEGSPWLTLLVSWSPIIFLVIVWVWFLRRAGVGKNKVYMERGRAHMDRVEQQNEQILAALDRIEKSLREPR